MASAPFVHAVHLCALAFDDRRREGSHELYVTHALDVAQALGPGATKTELQTAVLHDVLEDSDWTRTDLADSGVDAIVLEAVDILTRRPHEGDEEFIARICATPGEVGVIARHVKLADLSVNLANAQSEEERERFATSIPIVRGAIERTAERDRATDDEAPARAGSSPHRLPSLQ